MEIKGSIIFWVSVTIICAIIFLPNPFVWYESLPPTHTKGTSDKEDVHLILLILFFIQEASAIITTCVWKEYRSYPKQQSYSKKRILDDWFDHTDHWWRFVSIIMWIIISILFINKTTNKYLTIPLPSK